MKRRANEDAVGLGFSTFHHHAAETSKCDLRSGALACEEEPPISDDSFCSGGRGVSTRPSASLFNDTEWTCRC